ncbi:hypothetical protein BCR44DRAFT_1432248 [Catenaria anguillulae PL171]|uniref:DUF4246 domain-containing protein n=1 Tax=Catenaria anguillulae PL171 TaxID=765915 RepID=A0A1Y2HPT6_9FUNG|nr:hypothetical protein BCR44DRAFT_1432248 [Catenaria anguillulae PL171]
MGHPAVSPATDDDKTNEPLIRAVQARLPFLDLFTDLDKVYGGLEHVSKYFELVAYPTVTLVEQQIAAVLNAVRNKRHWASKFRESPTIGATWRRELELQMQERNKHQVLRYAFKELAWQAQHEPLAAGPDNVFALDSIVAETTRLRLVELAAKLEQVPEHKKDWHPNSNNQVLNLVHPSLFPVVYGKTCAFPPDQRANSVQESVAKAGALGAGVVHPPTHVPEPYDKTFVSQRFQWLPAEIQVNAAGTSARFVSYINNLHPDDHAELYEVLGDVFASMVPLFEQALVRIDYPRPIRICTAPDLWYNTVPIESGDSEQESIGSDDDYAGILADQQMRQQTSQHGNAVHNTPCCAEFDRNNDHLPMFAVGGDGDDPMDVDSVGNELSEEEVMTAAEMLNELGSATTESESEDPSMHHVLWDERYEHVYRPNVPRRFVPPAPVHVPTMSPHSQLAGKRLQVIVKLANIHLTPDNPTYPGGSWHVEGMLNESIVATGLYYYAMDNITESRLHFRTFVQPPTVDNNQQEVFEDIFGLDSHGMGYILCQGKGHVTALEGRAVVFPNMYQHKVFPFELADKSRPGYRKILAFFLVDPARSRAGNVLSSAVVPPQQADWLAREYVKDPANPWASKLPLELVELVSDKVGVTLDQAREIRLQLMQERSVSTGMTSKYTYAAAYNLCEH